MLIRKFLFLMMVIVCFSCSKEKAVYELEPSEDPYKIYQDAHKAFEIEIFFMPKKIFRS